MIDFVAALKARLSRIPGASRSSAANGGPFGRAIVPAGIEMGGRFLRAAVLDPAAPAPRVLHLLEAALPETMAQGNQILDPAGLSEDLAHLIASAGLKRVRATIMVGGTDVFVRRLALPRATRADALRALPSNASLKLPFEPDQMRLDLEILDDGQASPSMQAIVVAAKKEAIRLRQKILLDAGVALHAVDVDVCALFNIFEHCHRDRLGTRTTLVHVGYDTSLIVIVDHGAVALARQFDIGVTALIEQMTAGGMLLPEDAERALFAGGSPAVMYPDAFHAWADSFVGEVRRSASALRSSTAPDSTATGDLYLSGPGALIDGGPELLHERARVPVHVFDPLATMPTAASVEARRPHEGSLYTLALGLALRSQG